MTPEFLELKMRIFRVLYLYEIKGDFQICISVLLNMMRIVTCGIIHLARKIF